MFESVSHHSRSENDFSIRKIIGSSPLRIGAGILLITSYGWPSVTSAYQFFIHEIPWEWVTRLNESGAPFPHLFGPVIALLLFAVSLSWLFGFLTRLFSIILVLLSASALALPIDPITSLEATWLYLLIALHLSIYGSGMLSLDRLLDLKPRKKNRNRLSF
jgi:uncharacterized membrane protein YphA (DoxX/SURF4 family)